MATKVFSKYQKAIFSFVGTGKGNARVVAVAGSGKTFVLEHAARMIEGRGLMLAFNKSIATELQQRVPSHVEARTFHSLTYSPVMGHLHSRRVNTNKLWDLSQELMPEQVGFMYGAFVRKLVSLAKQSGLDAVVPATTKAFQEIIDHHDMELENEKADVGKAIEFAHMLLIANNKSNQADFDDLLYFTAKFDISLPQYDWVFVDEAQDTNLLQRIILRKVLKPKGRLIAVGDPAQAIYGFRGADSESMNLIAKDFSTVDLPLSISYRCPVDVVVKAKELVPYIEAAPKAEKGEVLELGTKWKPADFNVDDLIICQLNRPLVSLGFRLLRSKIPVRILGRGDIGDGLKRLVKKCDDGSGELDGMVARLEEWKRREVELAESKNNQGKAQLIEDKADSILEIAAELPEVDRSVKALLKVLMELFNEDRGKVTLCTVHKAKGLEANTVWWLNPDYVSKFATMPWQKQQETNIKYVAITRARKSLRLISVEKTKDGTKTENKSNLGLPVKPEVPNSASHVDGKPLIVEKKLSKGMALIDSKPVPKATVSLPTKKKQTLPAKASRSPSARKVNASAAKRGSKAKKAVKKK